jgi:hypothetical protein
MSNSAEILPTGAVAGTRPHQPSLLVVLLIFWGMFALAVGVTAFLNPVLFVRQDPDSLLRLVQVRDLLGGQGWFDLVQHRMNPPDGALMHWSRLIDAPVAGLIALGGLFGLGEGFALAAWPLLLFLAFMAGAMLTATALAGRRAALPALILALLFIEPMLSFLPNDIDHHNAQLALFMLTLAAALRAELRPNLGAAAGLGCATMLAIGLEMLPYVAVLGALLALRWALSGESGRAAAQFGMAFAAGSGALYLLTAPPQARFICDSISLAYILPFAVAGLGLATLTLLLGRYGGRTVRFGGLAALAIVSLATLALVAPDCLTGPFASLSPELKALWLDSVLEAQPLYAYAMREPIGAVATVGPPCVALLVAILRLRSVEQGMRWPWLLATAMLATPLALGFYQVRAIPYANAIAIPVLAAWLAGIAASRGIVSLTPPRRALPLVAAFLVAMPLVHLLAAWGAVELVSAATGGRIAPPAKIDAPKELVAGLNGAEKDCLDDASRKLFASVPAGLVLSPVFYGSSVLNISNHSVVAGPYHRIGAAILDSIHAMRGPPDAAREIVERRNVAYIAICSTSREAALTTNHASDGLLAALLAGRAPAWLEPVAGGQNTMLRLWRVIR